MDHKEGGTRSARWAWRERSVDPAEDHFELRYGFAEDSDWNTWVSAARVGRPLKRVFGVEFIINRSDSASAPLIDAVVRELDFYLVTRRERSPWHLCPVPLRNRGERVLFGSLVVSQRRKEQDCGQPSGRQRRRAHSRPRGCKDEEA